MKNLTPEMVEKAKTAKTAEELLEIAKANNVEITAEEAATYFAQLSPESGELGDDDLDAVSGGGDACKRMSLLYKTVCVTSGQTCTKCGSNVGTVIKGNYSGVTVKCNNCNTIIASIDDCTYEVVD